MSNKFEPAGYFTDSLEYARACMLTTNSDFAPDGYHAPNGLSVTASHPKAVMLIGSCTLDSFPPVIQAQGTACDFFNVNHALVLPEAPPRLPSEYGFQIVQLPLRSLVPDIRLMRLSYDDIEGHHRLFEDAKAGMRYILDNLLHWTEKYGIPAFVMNFFLPQQNPYGRLFPRYDIRNLVHFVERLNQHLAELLDARPGTYLLDVDQLAAISGRRYIQDDSLCLFSHGALLSDYDTQYDESRLDGAPPRAHVQFQARHTAYIEDVWRESLAMHRTLARHDAIKLVVVDLDDTVWRGVPAEGDDIESHMTEGWPIGFVEALLYLKRRGILLAALSRNDDARIRALWDKLYGAKLLPEDFVSWQVSWRDKPERMQEILRQTNLLAGNVLFIDDNPRERAAMQAAFPGMRVFGPNPYEWRRLLLWSAETQVPALSEEAVRRTEMVQAQITRETERRSLSREEFLTGLGCSLKLFELQGSEDPKFRRALELINRTNQFNTTGQRWSGEELSAYLAAGGRIFAFEATDRFTRYGTVAIALLEGRMIRQFVMSCRVFGLDLEMAAISMVLDRSTEAGPARALLINTDANLPARDLWLKLGFHADGDAYLLPPEARIARPGHIGLEDGTLAAQ